MKAIMRLYQYYHFTQLEKITAYCQFVFGMECDLVPSKAFVILKKCLSKQTVAVPQLA